MGHTFADLEVIATRGDRLALTRFRAGGAAYEAVGLEVIEVDPDGRKTRGATFDEEAMDGAFETLESWYLEGEAAPFAEEWFRQTNNIAAMNRRDFSGLPASTVIDHSLQWLPQGSPEEAARPLIELVPDLAVRVVEVHRLDGRGAVVSVEMHGTNADGGPVTWSVISVVAARGPTEIFSDDELEAALACFDELT
jgi:hypothetical protein